MEVVSAALAVADETRTGVPSRRVTPIGSYILQTVLTLLAVVAVAAVVLVFARRMGMGQPAGPIRLVGRLPLDGRRAVYLVRVGDQVFVIGASESGLNKLGEIPSAELPEGVEPNPSFADALARVLGREGASRTAGEAPSE